MYFLPSTILSLRFKHVRSATLYAWRCDLCNKLFHSILGDEEHKLRKLLPSKVTSNIYIILGITNLSTCQNIVPVELKIHLLYKVFYYIKYSVL